MRPTLARLRWPTWLLAGLVVTLAATGAVIDAPRTRRVVFICSEPPPVVFSDRPCGPRPSLHEVRFSAPQVPESPPASRGTAHSGSGIAPAAPRAAPSRKHDDDERPADSPDRHAETCRRIETAVRALDDRMRAGYSIREAARLWARWREARERLREADC